jgi:hypothetical protein
MKSFHLLHVLCIIPNSIVNAQGSIELFSDSNCTTLATDESSGPWSINQCIETYFSSAISVVSFPPCENGGHPILTISDLVNCQPASYDPAPSTGEVDACLFFSSPNTIGSAKFKCVGGTSISSSKSTAPEPTTFTTSRYQSGPTATTPTTEPVPGPTDSSQGGITVSGTLSISDKIALGTAIGIGIPALVFTILTWWNNWEVPEFLQECLGLEHRPAAHNGHNELALNGLPPYGHEPPPPFDHGVPPPPFED